MDGATTDAILIHNYTSSREDIRQNLYIHPPHRIKHQSLPRYEEASALLHIEFSYCLFWSGVIVYVMNCIIVISII